MAVAVSEKFAYLYLNDATINDTAAYAVVTLDLHENIEGAKEAFGTAT